MVPSTTRGRAPSGPGARRSHAIPAVRNGPGWRMVAAARPSCPRARTAARVPGLRPGRHRGRSRSRGDDDAEPITCSGDPGPWRRRPGLLAPAGRAAGPDDHPRGGAILRAGHRPDAAGPQSRGLADDPPDVRLPGLQSAGRDRPRQRAHAAGGLDAGDGRRTAADPAAGLRRGDVPGQQRRSHPGARRDDRRSALGLPATASGRPAPVRPRSGTARGTWRSTATTSTT